jgi:hypothetical protein
MLAVSLLGIAPAAAASAKHTKTGVAGTWSGTWRRTSAPPTQGTMTLTLKQKGSKLTGQENVAGSACLTTNAITGTLQGASVTWAVSQSGISAAYTGKISTKTMSGSLKVTCGTATGTGDFKLKKK